MDFIVARFNDTYGFISTGKDRSVGFEWGYKDVLKKLEKKDKNFTYACPEELAVHDHQREWTQKDRIYYNKLKHYSDKYNIQLALTINKGYER